MRSKSRTNTLRFAFGTLVALSMLAQTTLGVGLPGLATDDSSFSRLAIGSMPLGSGPCPNGAADRFYDVTALPIPISYNNFGDLDLKGQLFVPQAKQGELLRDVGEKLTSAGLGDLGADVLRMREALAQYDIASALAASSSLEGHIHAALEGEASPTGRVQPSPLAEPMILRAYMGECVHVTVLNVLTAPVSFHAHALISEAGSMRSAGPVLPDPVQPGTSATYTVWIPNWPGMEGAHFVHSHADPRDQTRHGLFGAIVAEPPGSTWVSTKDGVTPAPTGLDAIIDMPASQSDFREFAQFYHDEVDLVDHHLEPLPQVSPLTGEYGPGSKAISLRSEPFYDRFKLHDELHVSDPEVVPREHDKSQSYGSYTYGDPATHFQESYLGDPVKYRMMNAGPGQPHIHHLHGGGIRWRTSPVADDTQFDIGFKKEQLPGDSGRSYDVAASQRVDVQNINPGESFNIEPEGGSGGTQQSVGDFLYHCHIAEHYLAGMWSFWRVYNTLQPNLAVLPDRASDTKAAVDSAALVGNAYQGATITDGNLPAWVERQLPARGVPGIEDASVWDWSIDNSGAHRIYLGEPESGVAFPNWPADAPGRLPEGERPVLMFDPDTGRLAYPHLRPHFGERPPFAPEHGGAPYLGEKATPARPDGLCPSTATERNYNVAALPTTVNYNRFDSDLNGQVLARVEDRAAIQSGAIDPSSLVLRANAGDCVNVLFTNALRETSPDEAGQGRGIHSKTNIHIHLVQFDVQASDGVVTGFNYETTVRPLEGSDVDNETCFDDFCFSNGDPSAPVNTKIAGAPSASGGYTTIPVARTSPFLDATSAPKIGSLVGVGLGIPGTSLAKLVAVDVVAGTITVEGELASHAVGEIVGYEFVRYQWFPDVELGIVYFHDHVNGLNTWRHGLFGSLVVEPRNAQWLDPKRTTDVGAPMQPVAHVVDIVTPDGTKSFREIIMHFQDRACVDPAGGECVSFNFPIPPDRIMEPAAFNLRSEPLWRRNVAEPFSGNAFYADDSGVQDAPDEAVTLRAYPGDNVEVRLLYAGQSVSRGTGTFGIHGHRFQVEENLPGSRTQDAMSIAESSHHNWRLECGAGGCANQPGDYLMYMTNPGYVERGAWGMISVLPADSPTLAKLSSNPTPTAGTIPSPTRFYDVAAVQTHVMHNPAQNVRSNVNRFVLLDAMPSLQMDAVPPAPLVIRAKAGETIQVNLTNLLPAGSGPVGLHAGLVSAAPSSQGVAVGSGPSQTVGVGERISYLWYADRELGVADLVSLADPVNDAKAGLYGALIIEPALSQFTPAVGPSATVTLPDGRVAREHVLMFSSEDRDFQSSIMPYLPDVQGLTLINYATEPLSKGLNIPAPLGRASTTGLDTCQFDLGCGPRPTQVRNPLTAYATKDVLRMTPTLDAKRGEPVILRVVGAAGDQQAAVHLDGHAFATDADMPHCKTDLSLCKSNLVSTFTIGARETRNVWIPEAGVGGAGDYMYRNHREAFFEAGAWGILRVSS